MIALFLQVLLMVLVKVLEMVIFALLALLIDRFAFGRINRHTDHRLQYRRAAVVLLFVAIGMFAS